MMNVPQVCQEDVATMPVISFAFPPHQDAFTEDEIRAMDVGRRQLRTEWPKTIYDLKSRTLTGE